MPGFHALRRGRRLVRSTGMVPTSTGRPRSSSGWVWPSRAGCSRRASSSTPSPASPTPAARSSCCVCAVEARVWSCRVDERPARLESDRVGRDELEYVHHEL